MWNKLTAAQKADLEIKDVDDGEFWYIIIIII
jgi:hypothetical protein